MNATRRQGDCMLNASSRKVAPQPPITGKMPGRCGGMGAWAHGGREFLLRSNGTNRPLPLRCDCRATRRSKLNFVLSQLWLFETNHRTCFPAQSASKTRKESRSALKKRPPGRLSKRSDRNFSCLSASEFEKFQRRADRRQAVSSPP